MGKKIENNQTVIFFSKLFYFIFGFFDPTNNFFIIKINSFWGDLSCVSAKTATLIIDALAFKMELSVPVVEYVESSLHKYTH